MVVVVVAVVDLSYGSIMYHHLSSISALSQALGRAMSFERSLARPLTFSLPAASFPTESQRLLIFVALLTSQPKRLQSNGHDKCMSLKFLKVSLFFRM